MHDLTPLCHWNPDALSPRDIIMVGGTTASGKSRWTMDTIMASGDPHRHCIINADSMQVYNGLGLLTATPTEQERALVSHHLYAVADPYAGIVGVAQWRTWVHDTIDHALAKNQRVWIVGGTGFYLRTLFHGLSPIPDMAPTDVQQWREHYDGLLWHDLHTQLALVDEAAALRLKDKQRMVHALVVWHVTGRPLSWWHQHPRVPSPYTFVKVLHWPSPTHLQNQVISRWAEMVNHGVVDQVRQFCQDPRWRTSPLAKALGVRTIDAYVNQTLSWAECQDRYVMETAQYIKRQKTWFRWQYEPDVCIGLS